MHLAAIHVYPVKSCAGLDLPAATVRARGLEHDRRWMVVDPQGRFITGRKIPAMVRVRAEPDDGGLRLRAPGAPELRVATPAAGAPRMAVEVWKDVVDAARAGAEADQWLSRVLGQDVRLVHMDAGARRPMKPGYSRPGDDVSFADSCPLMAISAAALDALNQRLSAPVPMQRFRPNLVIGDSAPHAEDGWRRVRIGGVEFDAAKPCTRCVFTTVDTGSGQFDPSGEPLRTLKVYRREPAGITLGMHLIPRGNGTLRVGDAVEVID